MVKLAILDETLGAQVRHTNIETGGVELIYVGHSLPGFRKQAGTKKPDVMVVDLSLLGDEPGGELDRLMKLTDAELTIVLYHYAKRDLIDSLATPKSRPIKAPVTVSGLRLHILSLIVKDILKNKTAVKATA